MCRPRWCKLWVVAGRNIRGLQSNCLSVQPIETEFGRKTAIHQASCNKDYSCLQGDCPAFIIVVPNTTGDGRRETGDGRRETRPQHVNAAGKDRSSRISTDQFYQINDMFPEPQRSAGDAWNGYMMGIGGTGVVTINQVLGTAAVLDGKYVVGLDQTGFLGFDILTATAAQNLTRAHAGRTVAVVSTSHVPTGGMVASAGVRFPPADTLIASIAARTRADANVSSTPRRWPSAPLATI